MKQTIVVVVLALMCASLAPAQETTGAIIGTVTSQDAQPLPGVTVVVLDVDTGLERAAVSDGQGEYRLVALPPSAYELTASLEGFQSHRRSVRVELGRTMTLHIEMALGTFSGTVEVSGEPSLIDVTSTVTGINVSADQLHSRLPLVREVTEVAFLAPSTVGGDSAFEEGFTPGQRPVSMAGGSVSENAYQVNGLNITNFRTLVSSTMVPYEFLEEVQVKAGGYQAEFGRATGGVINMVTKGGTNSFRGGFSVYAEPESLQSQQPDTFEDANQMEDRELVEANAFFGGPILRDKLFFFGFVRYADASSTHFYRGRGEEWSLNEPYWGGRLDWNITSSHRLEGTYINDEVEKQKTVVGFDLDTRTVGDVIGVGFEDRGGDSAILKYTGIYGDSVLLSAQYGYNDFARTDRSDNDHCPYAWDWRSGDWVPIGCWVNWNRGGDLDEREVYRLDVDWFAGAHSLRAGVDTEDSTSHSLTDYSGGVYYSYFVNADGDGNGFGDYPAEAEMVRLRHYGIGGTFPVESRAAYIQDSWAVAPALTVNLGLRYEEFLNKDGLGEDFIEIDGQWAPRLGVIWDPGGRGRQKLVASFGRYYLPVASNTGIMVGGAESGDETWYAFDGEPDPVDGSPPGFTDCGFGNTCPNQGSVGEVLDHYVWVAGVVADPRAVIAEGLEPMYQDEVSIGYERMLGEDWSVAVRGVGRQFKQWIEDIALDQPLCEIDGECEFGWWGVIANPGDDVTVYLDLDGDGIAERVHYSAEQLGYPEPERKYYALELSFKRRFADNWMLQGSYTWSHLYGNSEGYVDSEWGTAGGGVNYSADYPGMTDNSYGDMPNDRRHHLKVFGSHAWQNGLQLGGNFWYHSGRPVNALSVHPTDPWAASYGASSFFLPDGTPAPRGSQGRTDNLWSLDLMVKYDLPVSGVDLFARLDAFNLFDNHGVAEVDEHAENDAGAINPYWRETTLYQRPRSVRLGLGLRF
jgi:hypothetical protein